MRRSLFECDSYEHVFRPLIKDSSICIDKLGKQRQKKNIVNAINACSDSSGASIYVRKVPLEKSITTKCSEKVFSNQKKSQDKNVKFKSLSQQNPKRNVAFTMDHLGSKARNADRKCQRKQPQPYKGVWKHVDPENLIKVEPTRYYVMLPPIRKLSEEKSVAIDMCQISNMNKRLKDISKEPLTSLKESISSERLKLTKSSASTKTPLRPTDCDIVFGHKKLARHKNRSWNGSRIDWMLDLEHRQELRRKQQQLWKATSGEENNMDLCCFPFIRNVFVWNF